MPETSPAIENAIFNATGARITSLPITPEKVLQALRENDSSQPTGGETIENQQ